MLKKITPATLCGTKTVIFLKVELIESFYVLTAGSYIIINRNVLVCNIYFLLLLLITK